MKKYFSYEFRKNFRTLLLLTAVATVVYLATVLGSSLFDVRYHDPATGEALPTPVKQNANPLIWVIYTILGVLCFIVPALMYAYKTNKRSVDVFCSLPIKAEKMFLVKTLVGLLLVAIPYTVAYWLGFLGVVCRENYFHLIGYLPGYFFGLLFGFFVYGINAFAFTRANRVADGVIFMLAYTIVGFVVVSYVNRFLSVSDKINSTYYFSVGGLVAAGNCVTNFLRNGVFEAPAASACIWTCAVGVIAYALTFSLMRFEKRENAEQNSSSPFGYLAMIPLFTAFLIGIVSGIASFCMVAVGAVVATVVYTRKALFGWKYWLMIVVGVALGLLLALAVNIYGV